MDVTCNQLVEPGPIAMQMKYPLRKKPVGVYTQRGSFRRIAVSKWTTMPGRISSSASATASPRCDVFDQERADLPQVPLADARAPRAPAIQCGESDA
ncbi:hypothetical protein [Xanthomonas phage MYK3]|nr:hypothetical protein [Xanthomonas phage MYK3]